jgi:hypothetical protein
MSSRPVKRRSHPVRVVEGDVVDVPAPVVKKHTGFSFRYSFAEISTVGSSAQLKAKHTRYQNGKLTTESFEGELDPETYEQLMNDTQRFFVEQTALYLRAFGSFLLPFNKDRE